MVVGQSPASTHGHAGALDQQVEAFATPADRPPDLHGMQEARGSSPLSSTFRQGNGMIFRSL
jgi:hypothetical protein